MTQSELESEIERYPWFGAARCMAFDEGVRQPASYLLSRRLRDRVKRLKKVVFNRDEADLTISLIDEFISGGEHRISVDERTPEEIDLMPQRGDDGEFASEELAEIYASQGLFDAAEEIYRFLSLQEPKKSIYFAELIEKLNEQRVKTKYNNEAETTAGQQTESEENN